MFFISHKSRKLICEDEDQQGKGKKEKWGVIIIKYLVNTHDKLVMKPDIFNNAYTYVTDNSFVCLKMCWHVLTKHNSFFKNAFVCGDVHVCGGGVYVHIYVRECRGQNSNVGVFHQMRSTFHTGVFNSISEMSHFLTIGLFEWGTTSVFWSQSCDTMTMLWWASLQALRV